jgi:hypothetical protein
MPPQTAGFGNRDRFELNGKIDGTARQDNSALGMLQWQHNVALHGSIPLQPARKVRKFACTFGPL